LTRLQEITSTEKLLDFIRSKGGDPQINLSDRRQKPSSIKGKLKLPSFKVSSKKNEITIGIDIGHECLRLIKAARGSDNRWKFLEYRNVSVTHITSRTSAEFSVFLKSQILTFCGDVKQLNLWAIMSAARVNVRHIRIPKVAKQQIQNAVYWTMKKETPFDEKDTIFDFEIQKEVIDQGVKKWLIMVYTAPREEVEDINKLFLKMGLQLTGISITPFAIQNIFNNNWIPPADGAIASLFIGNDFSRIDIYDQGRLIMTRGIKAGINSMVELMTERLSLLRDTKAKSGDVLLQITQDEARKVLFSLSPESQALEEDYSRWGLTEEEKFSAIIPALERVVRQVERTLEHSSVQLKNNKVAKIYVSTVMNIYNPLVEYVGEQLGIKSEILDPINFLFDHSDGELKQISASDRVALVPALGLALSDNEYTPNLLFRFKDKEEVTRNAKISRIASMAVIAVVLTASVSFLYQLQAAYQKENKILMLESQLSRYPLRIDRDMISKLAAVARDQDQMIRAYAERYLGMAVVSEISEITPANIRLISLKANLMATSETAKSAEKAKETDKETAKESGKSVVMEGVISSEDRKMLDSMLAGYVMKLEASRIFHQINVQKNTIEPYKKNEVLHFILNMKIG